jgi:glycosyltransferase involved in cell wall biosynthesis
VEGMDVYRTWVHVAPNAGTVRRALNYASFGVTSVLSCLPVRKPDVLIASTPQFFCGLAGTVVQRLKRVPFVLEVRDLWPDSIEAVDAGAGGAVLGALRRVERFMYRAADRIVAVSPAFRAHIEGCGIPSPHIAVVPNGVSTPLFHERPRERRHFAAWADRFIVAYIGTHGMAHALETALDAARLLGPGAGVQFVFVGEGARKAELRRAAADLPHVSFLDRQPREIVAEMLAETDAALVLLRRTPLFRTVIPSKMFEIMGAGVPMILGVEGEARRILTEAGAGLAIEPGNPAALADAVRTLRNDAALRARCGKSASSHVRENYDLDRLAENYLAVLQDTCAAH